MAAQAINLIKDQVYFSKKVGILMKGTSDDESPIPGYLYEEITDLSYQSPTHCEFLLEFFVKRMKKNSSHVKYKTLKLMKQLVEKGDPAFRKGLHRKSACIQEATKFGGPPHPLHGNVPYQAVRHIAKELSEILTEMNISDAEQYQQFQEPRPEKKLVGMGPVKASSGGKYYGFGNTSAEKKSLSSSIRQGIEKLAEQLVETPAQRQAALMEQLEKNSYGDYEPPLLGPQPAPPVEKPSPVKKVVAKSYAPGRAGGGWDTADPNDPSPSDGAHSDASGENTDRLEAVAADWSAEEQLVTESLLLGKNSVLKFLRPSQMNLFKKKCQGMNCEKVVEIINERLRSSEDYVVVRALQLLETFLFRSNAVSLDYIVTVCQDRLNHLTHTSPDQSVVVKADKIMRILEVYSSHPNIRVPPDQSS